MKKYRAKSEKYSGKLLQVRLAEDEYKEVNEFIKKFKKTKREWILAVINELRNMTTLRDNLFWESGQQYAYSNRHKYDNKLCENSKCELCGAKKTEYVASMVCHHHDGYEGNNALKVHIICNKCHGRMHSKDYRDLPWDEVISKRKGELLN